MSLPQAVIRTLKPSEWENYRDVRLRALADAPDAFCSQFAAERALNPAIWMARLHAAADSTRDYPLVAEVDGDLVGLLWAKADPASATIVNVFQVWVAPHVRGRGIAAALFDQAIAWAQGRHAHALQLSVTCGDTPAVRLYLRAGFQPYGPPTRRAGSSLMEQVMRLAIAGEPARAAG